LEYCLIVQQIILNATLLVYYSCYVGEGLAWGRNLTPVASAWGKGEEVVYALLRRCIDYGPWGWVADTPWVQPEGRSPAKRTLAGREGNPRRAEPARQSQLNLVAGWPWTPRVGEIVREGEVSANPLWHLLLQLAFFRLSGVHLGSATGTFGALAADRKNVQLGKVI
jgi:hypothetical protein